MTYTIRWESRQRKRSLDIKPLYPAKSSQHICFANLIFLLGTRKTENLGLSLIWDSWKRCPQQDRLKADYTLVATYCVEEGINALTTYPIVGLMLWSKWSCTKRHTILDLPTPVSYSRKKNNTLVKRYIRGLLCLYKRLEKIHNAIG